MTIDSRVVNGRVVEPSGISERPISIDNGRIVHDVGDSDDVWRTVDASGYLVLPGLIQPGAASSDVALQAARHGTTTVLTTSAETTTGETTLHDRRNLDHVPVWRLPESPNPEYLAQTRSRGIRVIETGNLAASQSFVQALAGATLRVPASSPHLEQWLDTVPSAEITLVVTGITSRHLDRIPSKTGDIYLETDVAALNAPDQTLWHAVLNGVIDMVVETNPDPGCPIMQYLYHEGAEARGLPVARIAELTATTPARVYGLFPSKGSLNLDADADLFVFDPEESDHNNTSLWPGRIIFSLQRGNILLYNDELHALPGDGQRLDG